MASWLPGFGGMTSQSHKTKDPSPYVVLCTNVSLFALEKNNLGFEFASMHSVAARLMAWAYDGPVT